ncbi:PspC domain-containing protein [Streptomyces sp. L7]|uniref:PspC domain-containing protein n=1 Tax=Streptomyces sp. L7 TaxID=3423954 RepID=UPI003D9723A9
MVNDSTTPPPSNGVPSDGVPSDGVPPNGSAAGGPQAPYGGPQTGLSGRGTRFFDWMRSLGVTRTDGWIGGVCAGVAYRIGIDPLIVRGIVVVAALLGAPAILFYALAWALLPDRDGRIHLQRLFEGEFEPPMVAIGVLVVLSLLPWSEGVCWFGHDPGWGDPVGRVIWTLIVLAAATTLIVFAGRQADRRWWTGSAGGAATAGQPSAPASPPLPTTPTVATVAEPTAPPAPGAGATDREVTDWRARQAQWKAEHDQWKQRLSEDMRTVKAQRSAQLRAQASAANAEAEARRVAYRAANPRVGAAVGWLAVGLALVAGALAAALWGPLTGLPGYALTAALAAATLVFGVTILIAGIARRRSGFLIFLGILLAALTVLAALLPTSPAVRLDASITAGSTLSATPAASANYLQAVGDTTIDLTKAVTASGTPVVNLAKGPGPTTVIVPADSTVRVEAATASTVTVTDPSGGEQVHRCDPEPFSGCSTDILVGPGGTPEAIVRVAQIDAVRIERVQK